jgi:hypothetical protein
MDRNSNNSLKERLYFIFGKKFISRQVVSLPQLNNPVKSVPECIWLKLKSGARIKYSLKFTNFKITMTASIAHVVIFKNFQLPCMRSLRLNSEPNLKQKTPFR